jgi:hypothetical protein
MSEEMLSNEERNRLLSQVLAQPDPKVEGTTPKKSSVIAEGKADLSQPTFGELLEKTIQIRDEINNEDKEEDKRIDEARNLAISKSRMDILKDFRL